MRVSSTASCHITQDLSMCIVTLMISSVMFAFTMAGFCSYILGNREMNENKQFQLCHKSQEVSQQIKLSNYLITETV